MTALFRKVDPAKKFRITKGQIARFLGVSESTIVKVQLWAYVLFVHRRDIGGQFISYRKLEHWKNAIAAQIQKCRTIQELKHLWSTIKNDRQRYKKQYQESAIAFWQNIDTLSTNTTATLVANR